MNLSAETLKRFGVTPVFLETGTFIGDGVQAALDAGFERVHSVEINPELASRAASRFLGDPRVRIHTGTSPLFLQNILRTFEPRSTILLDAHFDGGETSRDPNLPDYPILEELTAIKESCHCRPMTIYIDDVRLLKQDVLLSAIQIIASMSQDYVSEFIDGAVPKDVLACHLQ